MGTEYEGNWRLPLPMSGTPADGMRNPCVLQSTLRQLEACPMPKGALRTNARVLNITVCWALPQGQITHENQMSLKTILNVLRAWEW